MLTAHYFHHLRTRTLCVGLCVLSITQVGCGDEPKRSNSSNPFQAISRLLFGSQSSTQPAADVSATHRQVAVIPVVETPNQDGQALGSFCLSSDGNILAAIQADSSELRELSPDGELLRAFPLTIQPEAVNVGLNGQILVAGEGKVLILSSDGEALREANAPHVDEIKARRSEIKKEVAEQLKESVKSMGETLKMFQEQEKRLLLSKLSEAEVSERQQLESRIAQLKETPAAQKTPRIRRAIELRQQLIESIDESAEWNCQDADRQQLAIFREQSRVYVEYIEENGGTLTDDQLESQVEATIQHKCAIASISTDGTYIYLVTGAAKGYGFDVWRIDSELSHGTRIVEGLRGCCGQMDVQARSDGLYVAENSRHRVSRYTLEGKSDKHWGSSSESDPQGFGSCCNPMNLAFGADGSVYTAESELGRIKKYSADGDLLAVIGSVELVPGCKKVSIAATADGQRVYMLDITRGNILVMEAQPDQETGEATTGAADGSET